jgi:hypothetical protein
MYDDLIIEKNKRKDIEKDERPQLELELPLPEVSSHHKSKEINAIITIDLMDDEYDNVIII